MANDSGARVPVLRQRAEQEPEVTTPEHLLSVEAVGLRLGVSRWTVYRIIDDGDLAVVRVRGQMRVRESALERYVNTREEGRARKKRRK